MATRLVLAGVAAPGSWHQQVLKGVEKQRFGCWQGWPRWLCGNGMEKSLLSSLFHDELCRHEWLKHRGNVKLSKWQCLKLFDVSCGVAIWRSEFTSDFVSEILEECNEKQSCCFLPMKLFRNSPISEKLLSLNRYKLWKNVTVGHASIAENWKRKFFEKHWTNTQHCKSSLKPPCMTRDVLSLHRPIGTGKTESRRGVIFDGLGARVTVSNLRVHEAMSQRFKGMS